MIVKMIVNVNFVLNTTCMPSNATSPSIIRIEMNQHRSLQKNPSLTRVRCNT